ncbi:hypothetical protein LCGC14_0311290 [marine sediment metagenome]|uniref:Uncharacterized protein n=1 Tax=marine sediment metagenome TaxID=412755 RepID=A0A0F9W9I1_9ZZZZ
MNSLVPLLAGISLGYSLAQAGDVPYIIAANIGVLVFIITAQLERIAGRRKL